MEEGRGSPNHCSVFSSDLAPTMCIFDKRVSGAPVVYKLRDALGKSVSLFSTVILISS